MKSRLRWDWLIPLVILLPVAIALLPGGLPNTADGRVHFYRSAEMVHAWQDGVIIPRWSANLGFGLGIPLFVYAPPFPYYLTALFHSIGLPLEAAYKGMLFLGVVVGCFGSYRLARDTLGVWPGAVAAAAYLYAPILLRELFIQGNAAQLLAWIFFPWVCWATIRSFQTGQSRYAVALAVALMGALLSHNAAALLAMGMTLALIMTLFLFTRDGRAALTALGGVLLGLTLSAWFWAPALLEGEYVQLDKIVASDFRPRFVPLADLIALSPRLDTGAINPFFPLTLGGVQVWLAALGALLFLVLSLVSVPFVSSPGSVRPIRRLDAGTGLFFVLCTLFGSFMAVEWSEPIWRALPFVNLFEWPFRWHGLTIVGLSWLCAFAVYAVQLYAPRAALPAGVIALLLLMGSALVNLYPQKLAPDTLESSPADVVRFEVRTGAVGTTSLGEFNPIWVTDKLNTSALVDDYEEGRPIERVPNAECDARDGEYSRVQAHLFRICLTQPATLTLNLLYFPGWQAALDGSPIAIRPHPGSGLIDVHAPAGEHTLTLTFGETPLRRAADTISIVVWMGLLGLLSVQGVRGAKRRRKDRSDISGEGTAGGQTLAGVAGVIAVILLVYAVFPGWFHVYSPPDQALAASVSLRADFEDKIRLLGADLPAQVVSAGDALTVVAYWRALQSLDEDYAVYLHLDDPGGRTVATVDQSHPGDIPTSDWATGLHVRNPLRLTVPANALPIRYALRVGMYDNDTGDLLSLAGGQGDAFTVGYVWVEPDSRPNPPPGPHVRFGDAIYLLGAVYDRATSELKLYWQANNPLPRDYSIFVHALDAEGNLVGQADGAPYHNLYPTSAWRTGEAIEDVRSLTEAVADDPGIDRLAVGVYDPDTGERLPAYDEDGVRLTDDAQILSSQ